MRLVLVLLFALAGIQPAAAAARVALVIGNADYVTVGQLANPVNDATDLAAALERIGFTVTLATNLDNNGMRLALREFRSSARGAEMALVYFAGHGVEVENQNYLIPVDAELQAADDVAFDTIPLDLAMQAVQGATTLSMVLLDACRNNPFIAALGAEGRSLGRGLAPVEPTAGTLVAYASRGGTVALDGRGTRNSPYMTALLQYIEEPGLDVALMFRKVRDTVLESTNRAQEPFIYGSLPGREIYLVPPQQVADITPPPVDPPAPASDPAEEFAWRLLQDSADPGDYLEFIGMFQGGVHFQAALSRLRELSQPKAPDPLLPDPPAVDEPGTADDGATDPSPPASDSRPVDVADLPQPPVTPAPDDPAARGDEFAPPADLLLPDGRIRLAALGPSPMSNMPFTPPANARELAAAVQTELSRIGCWPGSIDGAWGRQSDAALQRLIAATDFATTSTSPSGALLLALRDVPAVICEPVRAGTIRWLLPRTTEAQSAVLEALAARYEWQRPGVDIVLIFVDAASYTRNLQSVLTSGLTPDIVYFSTRDALTQLANRRLLRDLSALITTEERSVTGLGAFERGGRLYGLPTKGSIFVGDAVDGWTFSRDASDEAVTFIRWVNTPVVQARLNLDLGRFRNQ